MKLRAVFGRRSATFTEPRVRGAAGGRIPAAEGGVAGVGKQKGQRRRFNGAVAKDHLANYGTENGKSFHNHRKISGGIVAPDFIPRHESFFVKRRPVEIQLVETVNQIGSGLVEREPFFQVNLIFKGFA